MTNDKHALDALITELLACGGMLARIIDHMARFHASGRSAPDAPPIPEVLRGLLTDILREPLETHLSSEIEMSTTMLREISEAISSELLLVPVDDVA